MAAGTAEGAPWQSTSRGSACHMPRLISPCEHAVLVPIVQTKKLRIPVVNWFAASTFRIEVWA